MPTELTAERKAWKQAYNRVWYARHPNYDRERHKQPRVSFEAHRRDAAERGIAFLLSFDQWWALWEQSGHWHERGRERGKYCMARFGDCGAYEQGNVRIVTSGENHAEYKCSAETRARISAARRGRRCSAKTRAKISAAARRRGPPSVATRAKLSAAGRRRRHTAAAREKIGIASTGRRPSAAARAKMSIAQTARAANRPRDAIGRWFA